MNYTIDKAFIDTNILIYAYVNTDNPKHIKAKNILHKELFDDSVLLSTQTIVEFTSVLLKYKKTIEEIEEYVLEIVKSFPIVDYSINICFGAYDVKKRYKFSWWDSLVVATALDNDCKTLFSEDLQHNQLIDGRLRVINPFL